MNTKDNVQLFWSADDIPKDVIYSILGRDNFPRDRVGIKLDRSFLTRYGLECIREIQERFQVPVFADAKIVEIPKKALELVEMHLEYQPYMLNVMATICNTFISPFTNPGVAKEDEEIDVLHKFAELCKASGTKSCAVTVLTSKTPYAAAHEYDPTGDIVREATRKDDEEYSPIVKSAVLNYARLMERCGLTDIVCSAKDIDMLVKDECCMDINTPSIRLPGSSKDDQSRISTPYNAIATGAKRLVVGRDIYRLGNDYKVVIPNIEKIFANIEGRDYNEQQS